ncbi:DUF6236 family protein [Flavobacterium sp. 17A]|uniref:DUF6236 family protein n=1 Tax=Flavobacterium potami TaxID=2872310 RepID=A0A9X1H7X1_9FLAO|nr:DUF6236 family protein [Flavobacterium potami]MBZ4034349.1 DUF6236 family protein [Flavobacterium potami]
MKRGIIANIGKTKRIDSNHVSLIGNYSQTDFNYYILYWDKIVVPTNNIIHQAIPNEEQLIKSGVLERPIVQFSSWSSQIDSSYDIFLTAQAIVANKLIANKSDTDWNIHQIGEEVIIAKEFQKNYNSLKVELFNCLPVPLENVNPDVLLEFKAKRKDELEKLHSSIDALYLEILKSPDSNLQQKIAKSELKKAIEDLEKVSLEKFLKTGKYNFTTELNLNVKDILTSSTAGFIIDSYTHGINFPFISIISGLASMVSIKANKTISLEKNTDKLKLSYIANASKEGIV